MRPLLPAEHHIAVRHLVHCRGVAAGGAEAAQALLHFTSLAMPASASRSVALRWADTSSRRPDRASRSTKGGSTLASPSGKLKYSRCKAS